MAGTLLTIEQTLPLLAAAPPRIALSTKRLTPAQLRKRPARDAWSAVEVLAHIRVCADVRGDAAIFTIVNKDRPTFRAIDPRAWMLETDYVELDFTISFRAFARQRARLLKLLEALPQKDWSRSATVTGAGAALDRSVLFYAQWLARHERPHLKQLERLASQVRGLRP